MKDFDKLAEKMPKEIRQVLAITMILIMKVYDKNKHGLEEFLIETQKMMDDELYIPDKILEMPGDDLESEEMLRDVMKITLGRRI